MSDELQPVNGEEFKIDINNLASIFKKHITIENNNKILFSGKFGIGKTYFLNKFFETENNEYEVFHLYPVNYQIFSNEDIIEFLKYDILVELLKNHKDIFNQNDYSSMIDYEQLLYLWGKENVTNIIKKASSYFGKLGRPLNDIIVLVEGFLEFKRKMELGDLGIVNDFLDDIKKRKVLETDLISDLIKSKLQEIKNGKNVVLILDDLERMDPEHIFRILNVFSACADKDGKNKFGFDKIILVADYNNLKSIFHHRYGEGTDSCGYFDKFFSIEVFEFTNNNVVINMVDDIISKFIIWDKRKNLKTDSDIGILRFILSDFLINGISLSGKDQINLRQLLKGIKFSLGYKFNEDILNRVSFHTLITLQYINFSIFILISIAGGQKKELLVLLEKIKQYLVHKNKLIKNLGVHRQAANLLLQGVLGRDALTEFFDKNWNNYNIKGKNGYIESVVYGNGNGKDNGKTLEARLYYDLLIEYVENDYYLKNNNYN